MFLLVSPESWMQDLFLQHVALRFSKRRLDWLWLSSWAAVSPGELVKTHAHALRLKNQNISGGAGLWTPPLEQHLHGSGETLSLLNSLCALEKFLPFFSCFFIYKNE